MSPRFTILIIVLASVCVWDTGVGKSGKEAKIVFCGVTVLRVVSGFPVK